MNNTINFTMHKQVAASFVNALIQLWVRDWEENFQSITIIPQEKSEDCYVTVVTIDLSATTVENLAQNYLKQPLSIFTGKVTQDG